MVKEIILAGVGIWVPKWTQINLLTRLGSVLKSFLRGPEIPDFDGAHFYINFGSQNNEFGRFSRLGKGGVL